MYYSMFLYIDPGTGGMLFTILFGVIGATFYFLRSLFIKLKFFISGGKKERINSDKIPIAIFSDHKRYWNIFEPICDELEKRKVKTVFLTASEDDPALEKNYEYISCVYLGKDNKAFSRLNMLNASVVVSTTPSLDVFQWKRSRDVNYYIHLPHAASDISMYRMFGIDHYDAIMLSGEYQVRQVRELEKLRSLNQKEIELVGIPYMDEMRKRFDNIEISDEHERTVLLAPSWGKSGILSQFGDKLIDSLIDTGYKVIIRPHPQSYSSEKDMLESLMKKYQSSDRLEWNCDNDNFDVLCKSDILISDFSGVIFDFALVFDKPVIYTSTEYDKAPYDCAWLDEEPWTFSILPKLGQQLNKDNISTIKSVIDDCIENPVFQDGRNQARNETWMYIGEGTTRSVDFILKKYDEICKTKEGDAA